MNKIFETPLYPYYQSVDQTASAPAHHSVVVIGAGPVGLGMAIDLAQHGIDVVVLDDNDKVSFGSRAICFAKRTLEIADRLGFGDKLVDKGFNGTLAKCSLMNARFMNLTFWPKTGTPAPRSSTCNSIILNNTLLNASKRSIRNSKD